VPAVPTLPAIINDLAAEGAADRYNGLGTRAFTTGFLLGPAAACLRLARHLPAAANHTPRQPPPARHRHQSSRQATVTCLRRARTNRTAPAAQAGDVLRTGNPGQASFVTDAHNRTSCATKKRN